MLGRKELGGIFVRFHALELPCLWRRKDIANSVATKDELDENRCNKILIELEEEEPQSCVFNWLGHSFASMQLTSYHVWETERYSKRSCNEAALRKRPTLTRVALLLAHLGKNLRKEKLLSKVFWHRGTAKVHRLQCQSSSGSQSEFLTITARIGSLKQHEVL